MPRSVNHVASRAKRKRILKLTRGYFGARRNVWTVAKNTWEKGLLYAYRPVTAEVTVDGVKSRYANVWLVPTMNGRYYGGGMMIAPVQDRLNREGTVTTVVVSCKSRIRTLITFPMIFSGAHKDRKDIVKMFSGSEIHVSFDRPTALQVDGETVRNVTEYTVFSAEAYRRKVISGEKSEKSGDTLSV